MFIKSKRKIATISVLILIYFFLIELSQILISEYNKLSAYGCNIYINKSYKSICLPVNLIIKYNVNVYIGIGITP